MMLNKHYQQNVYVNSTTGTAVMKFHPSSVFLQRQNSDINPDCLMLIAI